MNIFCCCLSDSVFKKIAIEADVFVSKKKKIVHIERPLISYYFFHELINIIQHYWNERRCFFKGYQFTYPRLNQSLKCNYGFIFFEKRFKENFKK